MSRIKVDNTTSTVFWTHDGTHAINETWSAWWLILPGHEVVDQGPRAVLWTGSNPGGELNPTFLHSRRQGLLGVMLLWSQIHYGQQSLTDWPPQKISAICTRQCQFQAATYHNMPRPCKRRLVFFVLAKWRLLTQIRCWMKKRCVLEGQPEHGSEEGEGGRRSRPAAEAVNVWSLSCLQPCSAQLELKHCKTVWFRINTPILDFQEGKRKLCFNTSNLWLHDLDYYIYICVCVCGVGAMMEERLLYINLCRWPFSFTHLSFFNGIGFRPPTIFRLKWGPSIRNPFLPFQVKESIWQESNGGLSFALWLTEGLQNT